MEPGVYPLNRRPGKNRGPRPPAAPAQRFLGLLIPALLLFGCGRNPLDTAYTLALPEPPPAWTELLGSPQWRIEWINPAGVKESRVTAGNTEITLPQTWASPVSAWPFWPGRGIPPGIFRPAGAIFPFDAAKDSLRLSWQGGVDAFLYWELNTAYTAQTRPQTGTQTGTQTEAGTGTTVPRRPQNFDWPRFRELFNDPDFTEKLHADPWTVDWKTGAAKIVASGFDKRRFVPEVREEIPIPVPPGPWIGVSPFSPPLIFDEAQIPAFPAGPTPASWFSPAGILRCTTETWMLIPWP